MVGIELGQEMKRSEILVFSIEIQFAVLIRKSYQENVRYRFLNNLQPETEGRRDEVICGKTLLLR